MQTDKEIPALDGLRGFACLLVVYYHATKSGWVPLMSSIGPMGIMLFFTLSGFLMAYHYMPQTFSRRYWLAFYTLRFCRLYPAFFVAMFGCIIFSHYLTPGEQWYNKSWYHMLQGWLLIHDPGIFWTIPYEFKFYALYPLLAFCLTWDKISAYSSYVFMLVWVAFLSVIFFNEKNLIIYLFVYKAFFLGGIIAACLLKRYNLRHIFHPYIWDLIGLSIVSGVLIISAYNPANFEPAWKQTHTESWFISPLLVLCVLACALSTGPLAWFLANTASRFLGKISYSVYLTHIFVLYYGKVFLPHFLHHVWFVFALVFAVSVLFYYSIEKPFHKIGKKLSKIIINRQEATT